MPSQPEHHNPVGKIDSLDTWKHRMRMPVPAADGTIVDLWIVQLYETTAVNGRPLDLVIEARKTNDSPIKRFGVIFSAAPPDWSAYDIPILWRQNGNQGVGRWR